MKNLTPQKLRCSIGACPSVQQLDDGRLLIVGKMATKDFIEINGVKVGDTEEAILIDPELLDDFCVRRAAQQKDGTVSPQAALQSGLDAEAEEWKQRAKALSDTAWRAVQEVAEGSFVDTSTPAGKLSEMVMEMAVHLGNAGRVIRDLQVPAPAEPLQSGDSAEAVASDGNPAVAGWLPHYADPLDVLTWQLSEAFGATISEKQWLAARSLLARFEP